MTEKRAPASRPCLYSFVCVCVPSLGWIPIRSMPSSGISESMCICIVRHAHPICVDGLTVWPLRVILSWQAIFKQNRRGKISSQTACPSNSWYKRRALRTGHLGGRSLATTTGDIPKTRLDHDNGRLWSVRRLGYMAEDEHDVKHHSLPNYLVLVLVLVLVLGVSQRLRLIVGQQQTMDQVDR